MTEMPPSESKRPLALTLGCVLTAAWALLITIYVQWVTPKPILTLEPNNLGDFAAGVAAPLAFLWLVIAVLLQKDELALQRAELKQSREALQTQARETAALVEQNIEAVQIAKLNLADQRRRDGEIELSNLIDELIQHMRKNWTVLSCLGAGPRFFILGDTEVSTDRDVAFRTVLVALIAWGDRHHNLEPGWEPSEMMAAVNSLLAIIARINYLVEVGNYPAMAANVAHWKLKEIDWRLTLVRNWAELKAISKAKH